MLLYRKLGGASRWAEPGCMGKSRGPRNSELCHRQRSALLSEKLTAQEGILINEIVIADCCCCGANYASARTNLASLNFGKNNALQIHSGKLCGNFFNQSLFDIYWPAGSQTGRALSYHILSCPLNPLRGFCALSLQDAPALPDRLAPKRARR